MRSSRPTPRNNTLRNPGTQAQPGPRRRRSDPPRRCAARRRGVDFLGSGANLLAQAEDLAARAWGASWARFSVSGSTHPNQAVGLTLGCSGQRVCGRFHVHKSVYAGLVLVRARARLGLAGHRLHERPRAVDPGRTHREGAHRRCPTHEPSCSSNPRISGSSPTSRQLPARLTRGTFRSFVTRPGARTSVSIQSCRLARSPPEQTRS